MNGGRYGKEAKRARIAVLQVVVQIRANTGKATMPKAFFRFALLDREEEGKKEAI